MKLPFSKFIEAGRVQLPTHPRTRRGDPFGAFRLRHQRTRKIYHILVSAQGGWDHVSVSRPNHVLPTWNEMCWVKDLFFDPEELVVQFHPPRSQNLDWHPALHLWRPHNYEIFLPPPEYV